MPSLKSWIAQGTAVTTVTGVLAFIVYTKHSKFTAVSATADPLFASKFYTKFNPSRNVPVHDLCVRRIPLFKIKRELVEDAQKGGTLLVERYCGGVFGKFGCLVQRQYLARKYASSAPTANQLYTSRALLTSPFNPGTQILNHFAILEKTPTAILVRAGDSPLNSPDAPRPSDGLLELTAVADMDRGFAEFTFKSLLYDGTPGEGGVAKGKPVGPMFEFAHRMYVKLLVETAVKNCMN